MSPPRGPEPVRLAATRLGVGAPTVVLHGMLGRARNWQSVARALQEGRDLVLPDLRNHGASPWSAEMSYAAMAADVAALIAGDLAAPATLIGHSMGGKVAMALALARPELVARLIVVDIAPVRYAQGYERFVRAMLDADLTPPRRRGEVDAELAASVPDPAMRGFLMQNLQLEEGRLSWQPNLAGLLAAMPELSDFPEPPPGARYQKPVHCLRGERSDYVDAAGEAALRRLFPQAALATVPGAGHWPHAEQPAAFLRLLGAALAA